MIALCLIKTGKNCGISFISSISAKEIHTTEDINKAKGYRSVDTKAAIFAEETLNSVIKSNPGYRYIWVDKPNNYIKNHIARFNRQYTVIKSVANSLGIKIIPFIVNYDGQEETLGVTIINMYSDIINEGNITNNRITSIDGNESIIFDADGNIAYSSLTNWFKSLNNVVCI